MPEVRPIDANAIKKVQISVSARDCCNRKAQAVFNVMQNAINEAPTLDYEPVVRCKDCKHSYFFDEKRYCNKVCIKSEFGALYCPLVEENHYCSYGAKMDEEVKE